MKKTIIAATVLVALTACNKSIIEVAPVQEYGTISLGVTADTEMVVTKATELDATAAANYIISLNGSQKSWTKAFSGITDEDRTMPAGSYTMQAKNISDEEAVAGNGAMQLVSPVTDVTVAAGNNTPVTLDCKVANSKITVATAAGFSDVFTLGEDPVVFTAGERNVALTPGAHAEAEVAWFNVGQVTWTLTAKVNSTNTVKTYTGSFDAAAAKWNQLTFQAGADGTISLTITVDETITEVPVTETINPLGGSTN